MILNEIHNKSMGTELRSWIHLKLVLRQARETLLNERLDDEDGIIGYMVIESVVDMLDRSLNELVDLSHIEPIVEQADEVYEMVKHLIDSLIFINESKREVVRKSPEIRKLLGNIDYYSEHVDDVIRYITYSTSN